MGLSTEFYPHVHNLCGVKGKLPSKLSLKASVTWAGYFTRGWGHTRESLSLKSTWCCLDLSAREWPLYCLWFQELDVALGVAVSLSPSLYPLCVAGVPACSPIYPSPFCPCQPPASLGDFPGARAGPRYLVALVDAIDELGAGGVPGEADGGGVGGFCMHVAGGYRGH